MMICYRPLMSIILMRAWINIIGLVVLVYEAGEVLPEWQKPKNANRLVACMGSKGDLELKAMVGETLMLASSYGCLLASQSYSTCNPRGCACIFSLSHIESCIEDIEPEILTIWAWAKPPLLPPPFHTHITVYLVYCCSTNIYFRVFIFLQSYFSYPCYRSSFIS